MHYTALKGLPWFTLSHLPKGLVLLPGWQDADLGPVGADAALPAGLLLGPGVRQVHILVQQWVLTHRLTMHPRHGPGSRREADRGRVTHGIRQVDETGGFHLGWGCRAGLHAMQDVWRYWPEWGKAQWCY